MEHTSTSLNHRLFVSLIWRTSSSFFIQGQSCSGWDLRKKISNTIRFRWAQFRISFCQTVLLDIPLITKPKDFFQEGDMIIHELNEYKRTLRNTKKIECWQKPWRHYSLRQEVTTTTARAFGLKQRALDFSFDKCEALISRLTVIFFFFSKKKIVHTSNLPDTDSMCVLSHSKQVIAARL